MAFFTLFGKGMGNHQLTYGKDGCPRGGCGLCLITRFGFVRLCVTIVSHRLVAERLGVCWSFWAKVFLS